MLVEWLLALEQLGLIKAIRTSQILYALVNGTHIVGLAVLVGSVVVVDLRVLNLINGLSWREMLKPLRQVSIIGLSITLLSGALLFSVRASGYIENPVFIAKLSLITLAILNAIIFTRLTYSNNTPSLLHKVLAFASLVFWLAIIFLGRWIGFSV